MTEDIYTYNRAYYLRFRKLDSLEAQSRYFKNYLVPNITKIVECDFDNYVAIEEDEHGKDHMILFLNDNKIREFIDFCNEENIIEQHRDITSELLTHDNLDEVVIKMIHSDEFKDRFDRFFERNTTMDSILDKISINGEDSLSEFEVEFLKDEVARNRTNNLHK